MICCGVLRFFQTNQFGWLDERFGVVRRCQKNLKLEGGNKEG